MYFLNYKSTAAREIQSHLSIGPMPFSTLEPAEAIIVLVVGVENQLPLTFRSLERIIRKRGGRVEIECKDTTFPLEYQHLFSLVRQDGLR